ncbi:TonB-dependent receptor [Mucilaginibacter pallidiroseus]|uniref:TonB-dependent receptor n=1 Tax=Mucilaginibacter pallidiroseus TaxID=2599295 RepID=A0A563U5J4_9SPHI|nr:TonB-dependent receptor [Mucilaginibacter pallidiroseus]
MGLFIPQQLLGQQTNLKGRVIHADGQPLFGAIIKVEGATQHWVTDSAGSFSLKVTGIHHRLTISHVGYKTASKHIDAGAGFIEIKLQPLNTQLAEVVVKDSHADDRRASESMNVEIVDKDFIRRNLGGSLMATLSRLPGIKTIGIGSGQSKPLIRGLGFNRVVVADKGIKHEGQQWGADHGLELDQFAAQEVEILKGAASFMYGADAIAGVVDVKPTLPPKANSVGGSIDLIGKTNNNLYGTSVNLYGRNKNWFFDSRISYQNYGDYAVPADTVFVYDYAVKLHNKRLRNTAGHETGLHLDAGFIGSKFRSVFYVSNVFSKSGFFANAHGLEPRRVDTLLHDRSSRDIQFPYQQVNHFKLINRSQYQAGRHLLQADLGYQHNFRQEYSQYVNHGYMPANYPDTMRIPQTLERQFDKHVYSINLRDKILLGSHELNLGVSAEHQNNNISGWSFLVPAFKQAAAGAYLYDKIRLNDTWLLHGAIRYDYSRINISGYSDWFLSEGTRLSRANSMSRTFNSLVWSAGANYTPGGVLSIKANIGKSFRVPIAKELAANGVNYHYFSYERGNPSLNAEQSYQADVSLNLNAGKWLVVLSPFYNYFPNYIYLNPTSAHDYFYGAGNQVFEYQQSRVMRYGGELQIRYQLTPAISAEALAEYLLSRQLSGAKEGYTLPFSPPPSVLFNLTYQTQGEGRSAKPYFSVDYRITAAQNNIVPPERKTPGSQLWNIQAGTQLKWFNRPLNLSLQVQNVFNTRYLNHTSFYRLIELPEAGRNIILSLKVPFGDSRL